VLQAVSEVERVPAVGLSRDVHRRGGGGRQRGGDVTQSSSFSTFPFFCHLSIWNSHSDVYIKAVLKNMQMDHNFAGSQGPQFNISNLFEYGKNFL